MLDASVWLDVLHQGRIVFCNDKEERAMKESLEELNPEARPLLLLVTGCPHCVCGPQDPAADSSRFCFEHLEWQNRYS